MQHLHKVGDQLITTYFLKSIAEDICKHQQTQIVPYVYYVGLSSTAPNLDGTGVTEPDEEAGYARVAVLNDENVFANADSDGKVKNHTAIYFPESIKPWDGITHYVIYDSPSEGNLLMYGALNKTMDVPIKTIISIPIDGWSIQAKNQ